MARMEGDIVWGDKSRGYTAFVPCETRPEIWPLSKDQCEFIIGDAYFVFAILFNGMHRFSVRCFFRF